MPEVTSYAPGAPSWVELSTTDEDGALAFYSALFGWEDDPQEMGPNWYYHMQKTSGRNACSIYQQGEEERSQNVPPHWNTYFTVVDVEAAIGAITQNGGQVVFGPMDVFEAGRMAMCQDPQGAFFAIWQPRQHIGAEVKNETGAMFWSELLTTDLSAAIDFYTAALGVERGDAMQSQQVEHGDAMQSQYVMLKAGGENVAGVMQITPEMGEFPPHWSVYFGVEDADASAGIATSLGANIFMPPTDIVSVEGQPPIGRFATMADPQGAVFSIFQPVCEEPQQ